MIVRARAALAAIAWACLAARVAGQAKQCDPDIPEISFVERVLDDKDAKGARSVLLADLNGDGDVDVAAAMSDPNYAMFRWYRSKQHASYGNLTFHAATLDTTPQEAWSIHAADVNGDGDVDLLLSQGTSPGGSFIQWQPPARHSPSPHLRPRRPRPRPARGDARRAGTKTTAGRRPSPTPRAWCIKLTPGAKWPGR